MSGLTEYLTAHGINPFVGGLVLGIIVCAIARASKGRGDQRGNPLGTIRDSQNRNAETKETGGSSFITKTVSINVSNKDMSPEDSAAMLAALNGGNKIEAIKIARESLGIGLKEAKDLVEAIDTKRVLP